MFLARFGPLDSKAVKGVSISRIPAYGIVVYPRLIKPSKYGAMGKGKKLEPRKIEKNALFLFNASSSLF